MSTNDDQATMRRLGDYLAARRSALGLTQRQVQERGGPSDTTQTRIEAGHLPLPRRASWSKIEAGYGLRPGSVYALLHGGEAVEQEDPLRDAAVRRLNQPRHEEPRSLLDVAHKVAVDWVREGGDPELALALLMATIQNDLDRGAVASSEDDLPEDFDLAADAQEGESAGARVRREQDEAAEGEQ